MDVRSYEARHHAACLAVFDSLTPSLIDSAARPSFESWLDNPIGVYLVMEHDEAIVGCGGYSVSSDGSTATLCWGMVRRESQRMGLGRFLLMYRIREIGKLGSVGMVLAHTPPASAGFFEKQGFRGNSIETDGRAPASDRVELIKKLTVCP